LLANGLILLAPFCTIEELEGADWIEAAETASITASVHLVLSELERLGLLVSRSVIRPEGGSLNVD
jgi:hypothetical protein